MSYIDPSNFSVSCLGVSFQLVQTMRVQKSIDKSIYFETARIITRIFQIIQINNNQSNNLLFMNISKTIM